MTSRARLEVDSGRGSGVLALFAVAALVAMPVQGHHSFAMYDLQVTKVFTGVVTRINPAPNHLQIFFAPMNAERNNVERDPSGEPVIWNVEMDGAAPMARQGVSIDAFPPGTIFSVGLHPLRSGISAGTREGGLFKCPEHKRPAAGMHCDSVEGSTAIGSDPLPAPKG